METYVLTQIRSRSAKINNSLQFRWICFLSPSTSFLKTVVIEEYETLIALLEGRYSVYLPFEQAFQFSLGKILNINALKQAYIFEPVGSNVTEI